VCVGCVGVWCVWYVCDMCVCAWDVYTTIGAVKMSLNPWVNPTHHKFGPGQVRKFGAHQTLGQF